VNNQNEDTMTPELIATCWVSAGNTAPGLPDETSPVPIEERIALVAKTGWAGIGLVHTDLINARDTIGYDRLAQLIRDAGIGTVEVEFLDNWWTTGSERAAADRVRADLFEAATALGACHIKAGAGMTDEPLPLATLVSAFSDLADEAEEAGVRLALEATPFSHLRTTHEAVDVVTGSDSPSAGLLVDIWHTYKAGLSHDELYKVVPIDRVVHVEIDDGTDERRTGLAAVFDDSTNYRKYCGEGAFDTATFIRRTLDAGYTGMWGVEIISEEHRRTPVEEGLIKARATALASFEAAARLS
jgi:sugar phosphate isomerase/epimerase